MVSGRRPPAPHSCQSYLGQSSWPGQAGALKSRCILHLKQSMRQWLVFLLTPFKWKVMGFNCVWFIECQLMWTDSKSGRKVLINRPLSGEQRAPASILEMQIALLIREKNSRTEKVDFETRSVRCVRGHHAGARAGLKVWTRTVVADGQFDSGRNLQKTPSCERSHPFRQFGTVWCMVVYQPLGRKELVVTNSAERADGSTRGNLEFIIEFFIAAARRQHHRNHKHKQKTPVVEWLLHPVIFSSYFYNFCLFCQWQIWVKWRRTKQKLEVRYLEDRRISKANPQNRAVLLSWTVWVYFVVQLLTALGCVLFVAHAAVTSHLSVNWRWHSAEFILCVSVHVIIEVVILTFLILS